LQQFLDSPEGEAAKRLLAESRSYVILGTRDIDDLIAIVGLTSRGLARANGCGLHLIDNPTAPLPERIVLIAAEEAVQFCAIADKNPRDPVTFMSYIKERLDSISKDALKVIALRLHLFTVSYP